MVEKRWEAGGLLPVIVPRPEHTLSRANIAVEALKVLYRLHHAGYRAYLVGGSVRDLLLGKTPKDFDVATDARPGEIRKLFRNSRIIGRRFRLVQVFFRGGKIVEVSTFRCRSEFDREGEVALAGNNTFGTPAEDAQRRDLTINGLFYNIADFSLVDYVGGLEDLRRGIIRVIGEPGVRFGRDPVRMLRVLRHAARTGFSIEPRAWEEIGAKAELIRGCPPARLRDELLKDLRSGAARPFLALMLKSGLFYALLPWWQGRLDTKGEQRLLELVGRLDEVYQRGGSFSESLLWGVFLTPLVEGDPGAMIREAKMAESGEGRRRGSGPSAEEVREWRESILSLSREALGALEFPRPRQEEVSMLLALERLVREYLKEGRPVPGRWARLAAYPEAWRLYRLKEAPLEEVLAALATQSPTGPETPQRRRRHRPRGRKRRRKTSSPQ